ncbi:hypothetical protein ACEWY4_020812 [Coilia grayii]|uniref:C1q domain-containing protein n=1 Tax=Coilia grayii TaxID=363190 RepID=A0ABD1J7J3_9TELE
MLRMKTAGAVLLLLWSGQVVTAAEGPHFQTTNTGTDSSKLTCQPDIHTLLREMSSLVTEQRVELIYTKTQLEAMKTRLKASESKAEAMETRLRASEKTVEEQRVELTHTKTQLEAMKTQLGTSESLVHQLKTEVQDLRREGEQSRVSFSASLLAEGMGNIGPSGVDTLLFKHVITNIGNAYNAHTGVFRAPIRGVYFFVVFINGGGHASTPTAVSLQKNGELVVIAYAHQASLSLTASNGASLLLKEGDVVYVKLWPGAWVYDNQNHHTTFSGHLLFPM